MEHFILIFLHYLAEIAPALAIGFFVSGLIHEFIPEDIVTRHLGTRGIKPIVYSTVIGTLLPVCCWGTLPIAVSFYKKGARLGPILAFLVATPATSVSALLVAYSLLGLKFTIYIFFAVIIMGIGIGFIGNSVRYTPKELPAEELCPRCKADSSHIHTHKRKGAHERLVSILKYAYIELPKEIGLEIFIGIILAAVVATFMPVAKLVRLYLGGPLGYAFAVIFGILMYICSTATVPLVDSLIKQGMSPGAGMTLLLIGPVTSYGTLLVLRKEFGLKVLSIFIIYLVVASLLLGGAFQALK